TTDWMVHMLGQAAGAYTDATHGMTLSAVSLPYYKHIMPYGLPKFVRFAKEVWGVNADGKTDEQVANEGLEKMKEWMQTIGVLLSLSELGATEDMIEGIADATIILDGGYKVLERSEVVEILKQSL
ncbi:MAG: iron-containing alcohol dehydrogenase, partial [Eubacterium sp.]|nr:iron-containing alcohol dehydrogenase [Eubacterium sp.]